MEIPCRLKFAGSSRNIRKLKQVLQDLDSPCVRILSSMPVYLLEYRNTDLLYSYTPNHLHVLSLTKCLL